MKNTAFSLLFLILSLSCTSNERSLSLENKRVVIIGDSITQEGHYVSYMEYYLQKNNPAAEYDIISVGLASETVSGLSEKEHPFPRPYVHTRLEKILSETRPEILFACYGMNDGIYHPQSPEHFQAFKDGYDKLVKLARQHGVKQIVILTPPPFDPVPIQKKTIAEGDFSYKKPYSLYNDVLSDYSKYLMSIKADDVKAVDLHSSLSTYTEMKRLDNSSYTLSRDGIHPGAEGHLLMAQTVLRSLKIHYDCINPADYSKINDSSLYKLVAKKRSMRSKGWLDFIGYTRGKTVKKESVAEIEDKVKILQLEIDKLRKK